jgi:hypothetical protein
MIRENPHYRPTDRSRIIKLMQRTQIVVTSEPRGLPGNSWGQPNDGTSKEK